MLFIHTGKYTKYMIIEDINTKIERVLSEGFPLEIMACVQLEVQFLFALKDRFAIEYFQKTFF